MERLVEPWVVTVQIDHQGSLQRFMGKAAFTAVDQFFVNALVEDGREHGLHPVDKSLDSLQGEHWQGQIFSSPELEQEMKAKRTSLGGREMAAAGMQSDLPSCSQQRPANSDRCWQPPSLPWS